MSTTSAVYDAKLNGAQENDITVNWPPSADAGIYSGNPLFVEVEIVEQVPTYLLRIVGPEYGTVKVRAVAGGVQANDFCMLALNRTQPASIWVHGTNDLNLGCGMMANSTNNHGFRTSGDISINADFLGVTGGDIQNGTSGSVNPTVQEMVPPVPDPYANSIPEPDYSSWPDGVFNSTTNTYECPGGACVWRSAVTINGGNVTFAPGIHVFANRLRINGGNVIANGVTFYSPNGNLTFGGSSTLTITPQTSGPYQGISMYVSRNAPPGRIELGQGGATLNFRGAFYMPTQELRFAGNPVGSSPWAILVSDTMEYAGTTTVNLAYPPSNEAPVHYRVTLVM